MIQRQSVPTLAGSALILPGLAFFIGVVFSYYFQLPAIRDPFDQFVTTTLVPFNAVSVLLNALIVIGPLAAFGLNVVPFVRRSVKIRADNALVVITITRESLFPLALILVGLALTAIFGLYLIGENWQCIIGAKASC